MKLVISGIVALMIAIVTIIFAIEPKTSSTIDNRNFMKDGYQNMYIDHENDNILRQLKQLCGSDRVAIYTYHNGTRSVTGIPFIKESIKSEITDGKSYKKQHANILINDNFYLNDYLYKNIYIFVDKINYNNKMPRAIIDTLLANNVKSFYARHIFQQDKIAGYLVVETTDSFMELDQSKLDSIVLLTKTIEKNLETMKREESETIRSDIENSRLYIFIVLIIFVLILSIYYGNHRRDELFNKTAETIEKNDSARSEQLDHIAAKLSMSILDNHDFMKTKIIELVTVVNKVQDRINILEEKVK